MKLWFETKLEKFGGPLKNLCGPPVEKHWSRKVDQKKSNLNIYQNKDKVTIFTKFNNNKYVFLLSTIPIFVDKKG